MVFFFFGKKYNDILKKKKKEYMMSSLHCFLMASPFVEGKKYHINWPIRQI